ncbi:hypothetical protein ABG768_021667 [Culter alburnus]|uniref:Uncharacterized protein n=1 Tax=Culter alburnus TaxID=194366 RepID=A0AAW2AUR4_CULAL
MSKEKDLLKKVHKFLTESNVFSSFPLSLLLLGLEQIIEIEFFLCPCIYELNALLTVFIFIGPALFIFALMYLLLRPFKRGCCCAESNDNTEKKKKKKKNCPKAFASCLIPPVMWIFILLLDGDYVACGMTDWKGVYVFDNPLNRSWCKPTEGIRNETELRDLTRKYIHQSQLSGYVMISIVSVLLVVSVGIYDGYKKLKGTAGTQNGGQSRRQDQEQSEEQL